MILQNSFYTMTKRVDEVGSIKASVVINKTHPIFTGHFPNTPIVPGVCMLQMVKEILEDHSTQKLIIREADNIKFLSVIDPDKNSELDVNVSYQRMEKAYQVSASIMAGQHIFFKVKALLQPAV